MTWRSGFQGKITNRNTITLPLFPTPWHKGLDDLDCIWEREASYTDHICDRFCLEEGEECI